MNDTRTILWLGGAPCAGKSSVAAALAASFDLQLYRVDDTYEQLNSRLNEVEYPALTRWMASSWDERWMQPLETLLREVIACYREHFHFVLADLRAKARARRRLLVEGDGVASLWKARRSFRQTSRLYSSIHVTRSG